MDDVYQIFEGVAQGPNQYVKFLGDGFMVIQELRNGHNCGTVRRLLQELIALSERVNARLLTGYPRPDGFRVRVTTGMVWKRPTITQVRGKFTKHPEYIGYAVNMAQSLLYVYPEQSCICHEGVVEILGPKKNGLVLKHLETPKERRAGIDQMDFTGLWSFGLDKKTVV